MGTAPYPPGPHPEGTRPEFGGKGEATSGMTDAIGQSSRDDGGGGMPNHSF